MSSDVKKKKKQGKERPKNALDWLWGKKILLYGNEFNFSYYT